MLPSAALPAKLRAMGLAFIPARTKASRTILARIGALSVFLISPGVVLASPSDEASPGDGTDECADCVTGNVTAGIRVSTTVLQGDNARDAGGSIGVSLWFSSEVYGVEGLFSPRTQSFVFLGGGAVGLEGGMNLDAAAGVRLRVGESHGPFGRTGFRAYLFGNDRLYESLVELPQFQVGYQFLRGTRVIELAGRFGPVLVGRFNTGETPTLVRKLGRAFEVGGHVAVHWSVVDMEVQHTHVLAGGSLGDVDLLSGRLCGNINFVQLCLDSRYGQGRAPVPGSGKNHVDASFFYFGLAVGVTNHDARAPEAPQTAPIDEPLDEDGVPSHESRKKYVIPSE